MSEKNKSIPVRTDAILKDNMSYNRYYMKVSSRFAAAKWITLLLFTVYLVCMLVAARGSITYENFMYLLRDFNLSSSASGAYSSVVYEEQQNMTFSVFKNALAVSGSSGIRLFDGAGNSVFRDNVSYKTPVLLTGDKYMLLYDEGGRDFSLLTTLTRVSSGTTEGDILCCAMSEKGVYAIAFRNPEAKFAIDVYNSSFRNVERIYRDSYVTGLALDASGDHIAIMSVRYDDWDVAAEVSILQIGESTSRSIPLGDRLPLYCLYMQGGHLAVVCDTAVVILSENGDIVADISLDSMTLSNFHVSERLIALVCSENVLGNENRILVYTEAGVPVIDCASEGKISSITASDVYDCVYLSRENTIEYLSSDNSAAVEYTGSLLQICEIEGRAVVCFPGSAFSVNFIK
jgi:hypothetical protein